MTSPFNWQGQPSIFSQDKSFTPTKQGKVRSAVAAESVEKVYAKGVNHGTMHGISKNYDAAAAAKEFHKRREESKKRGRSEALESVPTHEPELFREAWQTIAKIRATKRK